MTDLKEYVVAFNRDRDFYQLPAALAEVGKLSALVTDLYVPDRLAASRVAKAFGLSHRHCGLLPSKLVRWSPMTVWLQMAVLGFANSDRQRSEVFNRIDSHLSRIASKEAQRAGAGLFLYSGYALEAFARMHDKEVPKLLFVYHPQGDYVRHILEEDFRQHPETAASHRRHLEEIALNEGRRVSQEIALANGIACASNFTANSVRACLGSRQLSIRVVPYGCPSWPGIASGQRKVCEKRPQVLFVGQGTQRKGLHHLLKVWRRNLHQTADLTLVVNNMDPGIGRLIEALPTKPRIMEGLSHDKLTIEFERADIFVLPSLVEGFGLVYLEALAAGCHVIGTQNTGLPDLNPPLNVATVLPSGDLEALHASLDSAIKQADAGSLHRETIRAFAATRTWDVFRAGIRQFVREVEGSLV